MLRPVARFHPGEETPEVGMLHDLGVGSPVKNRLDPVLVDITSSGRAGEQLVRRCFDGHRISDETSERLRNALEGFRCSQLGKHRLLLDRAERAAKLVGQRPHVGVTSQQADRRVRFGSEPRNGLLRLPADSAAGRYENSCHIRRVASLKKANSRSGRQRGSLPAPAAPRTDSPRSHPPRQ